MSELKEHLFCECDECVREYRGPLSNEMRPYYLKSEADKVIAHNKYKRCLAMAIWCKYKVDTITNGYIVSSVYTQNGVMTTCPPECNPKFAFYSKWRKRWLELAERFKEGK